MYAYNVCAVRASMYEPLCMSLTHVGVYACTHRHGHAHRSARKNAHERVQAREHAHAHECTDR